MTYKTRLVCAALGALALFALALWAGGDATRARATDRPVDWPTRTHQTTADAGPSQHGTSETTMRDGAAFRLAQAPDTSSDAARPPRKRTGRTGGSRSRTTTPSSPADMFVDGVPRGSFEAPPRKDDATRGSHAGNDA